MDLVIGFRFQKRETQSQINEDLFWLFTHKGWCYDTVPAKTAPECPFDVDIMQSLDVIRDADALLGRMEAAVVRPALEKSEDMLIKRASGIQKRRIEEWQ